MTEQEKNTEAAAPTRPIVIGGQTYLCSQPTLSTNASIGAFIQRRVAKVTPLASLVNDPAFKLLPAAAQVAVATEAAKAQVSGARPLDAATWNEQLQDPDVLAFAAWLLCRPNHPGLKLEDLKAHITADNAADVFADLSASSGMVFLGEAPGATG
jgi:hypothetical protein